MIALFLQRRHQRRRGIVLHAGEGCEAGDENADHGMHRWAVGDILERLIAKMRPSCGAVVGAEAAGNFRALSLLPIGV